MRVIFSSMVKEKELTENQRLQIMLRYQKILDKKYKETVGELAKAFGVTRDYPAALYKEKTKPNAVLSNKPRSGAHSKSTPALESKMVKEIRAKRKSSSRRLAKKLEISHFTALKMRKKLKFIGVKTKPKPLLNAGHMQKRLQGARKNRKCTWKNWVFADFKWFNLHRGVKPSY